MKSLVLVITMMLVFIGCATTRKSDFHIPDFKEVKLKNGLTVLLFEDKSLPYVSLSMLVNAGAINDPEGKSGTANMVASLLDKGTQKRNAIEVADDLGQIAADFSAMATEDYAMLFASSLSFHEDKLVENFMEIITQSSFKDQEIKRVRTRVISMIKKTVDSPGAFASGQFQKFLYPNHPYGNRVAGSPEQLEGVRKADIIRFYLKYYRPNNATLAVVGNFSKNIIPMIEKYTAEWEPREQDKVNFPDVKSFTGIDIQLVDKSDLKQSEIVFGHLGIKRDNEDYVALQVANTILGGAFSSRLMREIRTNRGLTYGISSRFEAMLDEGPFVIRTNTRHDKVGEAISVTLGLLKEFKEKGVTEEEVQNTKNLLRGMFPRSLETAEARAQTILTLRRYGLSKSYLDKYLSRLDDVSKSDVDRVVQTYFHPDNMKILVFSPARKVKEQISPIGQVKEVGYKKVM